MSASSKKKLRKEQNAAQMTEKQLKEQKEAKKLRTQTLVFVVAVALVLAIGLTSLAVSAYKTSGIAERLTTALTIGEHKISAAELSYFYIDAINSTYETWHNQYGDYTATYLSLLYGLDMSKPLNEQVYDEESNKTYADYFVDMAIDNAVSVYTLYDAAVAEGHEVTDLQMASIEDSIKNLESSSQASGAGSLTEYLKNYYGNGATEKSFHEYLILLSTATSMETYTYNGLTYTADDLAAYNAEHFDEFSSFSYTTFYLSGNDFIECTAEEGDKDHSHTDEEKQAGVKAAEKAANGIVTAKPTNAEEFNAAIKKLSVYADNDTAACTPNQDVMFSSISNTEVAEWLVAADRKVGDLTVIANANSSTDENGNTVETPYGYTVVLYQGRNDNDMKLVNVRHILKSFTGATTDENGNTVYPESSIQAASDYITETQDIWLAGTATEEAFADLAKLNSTDTGSAANGGLYENVYPGQMVAAFNDWCFDESRQPGDYGIVETEYGFHLMYFVGHTANSYREFLIESTLRYDDYVAWFTDLRDAKEYTVLDTSKLILNLKLGG